MQIEINSPEEADLIKLLETKDDPDSKRLKRFLSMPDLSRQVDSPIAELVQRILKIPRFSDFDDIKVPEIVSAYISFDLFNFPPDHPARKKSDTYFVDEDNILRTHTTVMWYYHLNLPEVKEKIKNSQPIGALSYGKVYRRDEIDRFHMPVFHQIDGWYLCRRNDHVITIKDLQDVLLDMAKVVYGEKVKYRFNTDEFPYTDPSLEMEIEVEGRWLEVLGAGVVKGTVLKNFSVDPDEYNGWAFGPGLERLAMASMSLPDMRLFWSQDERVKKQLKLGNKFIPVSKYPPITRDISFIQKNDFVENDYFDLIRDEGGDIIEEVKRLDTYQIPRGAHMETSGTFRIVYRSIDHTLMNAEVDRIQDKIYRKTNDYFAKEIR